MATFLESLVYDNLASDPGSPAEGQVWYNVTDKRLKIYRNGGIQSFSDLAELTTHTGSTSNPHSTTLEAARSQNNTLAGSINMNSAGTITGLTAPSVDSDAATKKYVDDEITSVQQGLDWQESVLDRFDPTSGTPVTPTTGDRYLATATANGWTDKYIYEWDGAAWVETVPNEGFTTRVEDENKVYTFDGVSWGVWDATVDHGNLQGLGDDDHTQYHNNTRGDTRYYQKTEHISTSAGAGDSGKPIKLNGSGEVDITMIANGTAQWNADKLQGFAVGTGTPNTNDHLIWNGTSWAPTSQSASTNMKSGTVAAGSFTGSPKSYAVVFGTAYADNLYAVSLSAVVTGSNARVLSVSAKSTTGFTIELNSGSVVNLTSVEWQTVPHYNA